MEAPEGPGRITPLPPPEPDGVGRPFERAPRQWMPVGLALAGLVAFAIWLAVTTNPLPNQAAAGRSQGTLTPLSVDDAPPASSLVPIATSTTIAPTLGDMLPWLEGSLVIFSTAADGTFLNVWDATLPKPATYRLSGTNVLDISPEPESLSFVAYETGGDVVNSLYVGGWQRQEPVFIGSQGFAWDPEGSATIMWIGVDQLSGESALYRKQVPRTVERVAPMPPNSRLAGWTTSGLLVTVAAGPAEVMVDANGAVRTKRPALTELRDPEGNVLGTVVAEPLRATSSGTVVAIGTADAFEAAELEVPESALVVPNEFVVLDATIAGGPAFELRSVSIAESLADGRAVFPSDGRWSLSDNGRWAARLTTSGRTTAIAMRSLETRAIRVISLRSDGDKLPVGFTQDGEWFFTYAPQADELVAASDGGAQFVVPFAQLVRLGGVYVRP